jgi:DNA-binding winged helix-turn-helix (wHTH) protein
VRYTFGSCVLDDDTRQVCRSGQVVHLAPKAYTLLRLLLHARPRVLSTLELYQQVWPDAVVSESSLSTLVAELRVALGDSARAARYIRTAYGFGYAFVAPVTALPAAAAVDAAALGSCALKWGERAIPVPEGVHLVGRAADALVAIDDPTVSRHHARLTRSRAALTIEDLSSRNGTFRNGVRLTAIAPLHDGDLLVVGSVRLAVSVAQLDGVATLAV